MNYMNPVTIYFIGIGFFLVSLPVLSGVSRAQGESFNDEWGILIAAVLLWPLVILASLVFGGFKLLEFIGMRMTQLVINKPLPKAIAEEFPFAARLEHTLHGKHCQCGTCDVDRYLKLKPKQ